MGVARVELGLIPGRLGKEVEVAVFGGGVGHAAVGEEGGGGVGVRIGGLVVGGAKLLRRWYRFGENFFLAL